MWRIGVPPRGTLPLALADAINAFSSVILWSARPPSFRMQDVPEMYGSNVFIRSNDNSWEMARKYYRSGAGNCDSTWPIGSPHLRRQRSHEPDSDRTSGPGRLERQTARQSPPHRGDLHAHAQRAHQVDQAYRPAHQGPSRSSTARTARRSRPVLDWPRAPLAAGRCSPKRSAAGAASRKFHRDGWGRPWPAGVEMLCYMLSHEAHHRGQVCMLAHQLALPLPIEVTSGIWNWEKLWKECGSPNGPGYENP
jgi:hypothetical protein